MSASNITDNAEGAGCGGKNPWVTDKDASIGNPTPINERPVALAIVKTRGTKMTKPTE